MKNKVCGCEVLPAGEDDCTDKAARKRVNSRFSVRPWRQQDDLAYRLVYQVLEDIKTVKGIRMRTHYE